MPDVLVAAVHQPEVLWSLVATAPLFLTALEQVQAQGCTFTLDADSFQVIAQQAHLVGLHLMHSSRPTQHLGIDLFCTVDTLQSSVTAVQYLMSTSLDDALDVRSVVLTQASLEPVFIQTRNGLTTDPGPHQAVTWSFPRALDAIPPAPEPLPLEGWPPDVISPLHWFYAGQRGVAWSDDEQPLVRCVQIAEMRSSDPTDQQVFSLSYPVPAAPETAPFPSATSTPIIS
jgi:hypothetical protein